MTTIVMNTANGAVTEYDWDFQSLTSVHAAGAEGLFQLGGSTDAGVQIDSTIMLGKTGRGTNAKKRLDTVFFAMHGIGNGLLRVAGETTSYQYEFPVRFNGVSRAQPGRGINENYLAIGYSNLNGVDFRIDRIDAEFFASTTRRAS